MSSDIWRKDYQAFYRKLRDENKTVYDISWCRAFIESRLDLPSSDQRYSLLDVGCGDGIWSIILADYFNVTGVDNSSEAITNARSLNSRYELDVSFLEEDLLKMTQKFDYLFCRGPEFFGGYECGSEVFQKYFNAVCRLFTNKMYFITYSKEPFRRYANAEKTSYFHDPEELKTLFSIVGDTTYTFKDNYIVLTVQK